MYSPLRSESQSLLFSNPVYERNGFPGSPCHGTKWIHDVGEFFKHCDEGDHSI